MGIIKDRGLSFIMVIVIAIFIFASVVASTVLTAATAHLGTSTFSAALTYTLSTLVSIILFTAIFAAMFKIMPDIKIAWKDTLIGAGLTSIIFNLARIALSFYLSRSATAGPFGAAGSLVVIMLFVNYSAQILFLGAEFTQVWARRDGHPIEPAENALSLDPDYTEPTTEEGGHRLTHQRLRRYRLPPSLRLRPTCPPRPLRRSQRSREPTRNRCKVAPKRPQNAPKPSQNRAKTCYLRRSKRAFRHGPTQPRRA